MKSKSMPYESNTLTQYSKATFIITYFDIFMERQFPFTNYQAYFEQLALLPLYLFAGALVQFTTRTEQ